MYDNLAKDPDDETVIQWPEQVSTQRSLRRSNEEIIKQENVWENVSPTVHKNNQATPKFRRKRSKRKKQASWMKAVHFSIQDRRSRDVSEFLQKAKLERKQLTHTRNNQKEALKVIEQRIANSRSKLLDLHNDLISQIAPLTRYQTRLSGVNKDLSFLVQLKIEHAAEVRERIARFDSQRKSLMGKMTKPQWNKQHCFYMLALERFREKKQLKQIIDIAELMPGNIAITAVANHSMLQHKQALTSYQKLVVQRSMLEEKHSIVTMKLQICSCRLADYERLLWMMKKMTSSKKVKDKMLKAEKNISADTIQPSGSVSNPKDLSWNFRKRVSENSEIVEKELDEDDKTFWQNVDVKEFIGRVDEFLNEIAGEFAIANSETDDTYFLTFQHNSKCLDEGFREFQHSDDSYPGSSSCSSYGLSSSAATTPDPKNVSYFLTPTSTGSNCTSTAEMEIPRFSSLGGFTVETIPSLIVDRKQPQDYITSCHEKWNVLNEILETISVARKEHKICCTRLKTTSRKIEAIDKEVNSYVSKMKTSAKNTSSSTACWVEIAE